MGAFWCHDMKKILLVLIAIHCLLLAGCGTPFHTVQTWEYKTIEGNDASDATINQLAKEGWSVVNFAEFYNGNIPSKSYLLKRPVK